MTKFRIFISSTVEELRDARDAVDRTLEALEAFEPRRVEELPAIEDPSQTLCLDEIGAAEAVVLIIGKRYGFVPAKGNPEKLSVTHLEYREARRKGRPVFAFLQECGDREESAGRFVKEIEDFAQGVFRKKWNSLEDLALEVRRALVWWLARSARAAVVDRSVENVVRHELQDVSIGQIPIEIINSVQPPDLVQPWIDTLLSKVNASAERDMLPKMTHVAEAGIGGARKISVSFRPGSDQNCFLVEVRFRFPFPPRTDSRGATREAPFLVVALEVELTESAQVSVETAIRTCLFLCAEDPDSAVHSLLSTAGKPGVPAGSRRALLISAAVTDMMYEMENSLNIGNSVLKEPDPSSDLISTAVMNLLFVTRRLHRRRLRNTRAEFEADRLVCDLIMKGIESGVMGAEAIYTIAKHISKRLPKLAVRVYQELLRIHPFYEERWYWHRDLGLIFYGMGDYSKAARFYDKAAELKADDSQLFRFAGDAYYYQSFWASAIDRYQFALTLEPLEVYFVDSKVWLAEQRLARGTTRERLFPQKRILASRISQTGVLFARSGFHKLAKTIFHLALWVCPIDSEASRWLALYCNRRGDYKGATNHLWICSANVPEDFETRLNIALNFVFQAGGKWTDEAISNAKAAVFHGGSQVKVRLKTSLVNTDNRDVLLQEFEELVLKPVREEYDKYHQSRLEVHKPEEFGGIVHYEL